MTVSNASKIADVTEQTIRRWIDAGKIDAKKKGKAWSINQESLEKYLKERGTKKKEKESGEEDMSKKEEKEEETVETITTVTDPINELLNSEISRKKTLSALRALEDLDSRNKSEKQVVEKKDDLDLNTIIKFDLIKSLKTPPPQQTSREESKKDDMLEKLMLYQMMQQNSQKPAIASDKPSSELELLKRELISQRENEALKQKIAILRQEIKELQSQKSQPDFSDLERKLEDRLSSFQQSKNNDWAGILTGAGSVLSSLLQAIPMLRSEGISLTEIGDLVDRLTERKQQSTSADNFGGGNELMKNVVGLISSLAKQKQGQQAKQQFTGTEGIEKQQEGSEQATTASAIDQLALALTGAVKAADSPNSVINAIHSMLPYISEQHIPIIENLMNQLNPAWADAVVSSLRQELNVDLEGDVEEFEEPARQSRQSSRFDSSTVHDLELEEE